MSDRRPILDWKPRHDPRSRDFPIRTIVGTERPLARRRLWSPGPVLDQGSEGACVGFGWTGELLASPRRSQTKVSAVMGNHFAMALYEQAKTIDPWEGEDYSGTSVLAGAQAVQAEGFISGYRWCFGIEDVRDAIIAEGPVVIGIPWYESMYETAESGLVTVDGDMVGGHCILVNGYDPDNELGEVFRWRNSWGKSYGVNGNGWITWDDLADLLDDDGEACCPVGRRAVSLR